VPAVEVLIILDLVDEEKKYPMREKARYEVRLHMIDA
jgi:hypothetical protein